VNLPDVAPPFRPAAWATYSYSAPRCTHSVHAPPTPPQKGLGGDVPIDDLILLPGYYKWTDPVYCQAWAKKSSTAMRNTNF
jgi:hypothetical protein